jgi:ABC-type nickel/cobalt efflux system permease component RcnA
MKDDLLNLNATVATVLDVATWTGIASAVFITGFAAWIAIRIGRRTLDAFTRANQTVREATKPDPLRELAAHVNQVAADEPELTAAYTRLDNAIREETP